MADATPASTGRRSTTSSSAAPTRPARTTATSRAWRCCSPACRSSVSGTTINRLCGSGMDAVITAARAIKAGEGELYDRRRRREHEPRALRHAQGRNGVLAQRRDLRHHHRLALRQPADEAAIRRRFDARDRRERRRGFPVSAAPTRTPSRCAASSAPSPRRQNGRLGQRDRAGHHPAAQGRRRSSSTRTSIRAPTPRSRRWRSCRRRSAQGGTVTAGNASGVNDGAAALIVASEAAAKQHGLTPIARILGGAAAGVPPRIMGIGPAPATQKLCARLGLTPQRFRRRSSSTRPSPARRWPCCASSASPTTRRTSTPMAAPSRSAIRSACPAPASPAPRRWSCSCSGGRCALATMCIGVGQGIAIALERV